MSTSTDEHVGNGETPENLPTAADSEAEGEAENSRPALRKAKISWTRDLHDKFLKAIRFLGHHRAGPKAITEFMDVPGLTREHVASHLQKYRVHLKRVTEAKNKQSGSTSGSGQAFRLHQRQMTASVYNNGKPLWLQSPLSLTDDGLVTPDRRLNSAPLLSSSFSGQGTSMFTARRLNSAPILSSCFYGNLTNLSATGSSSSPAGLKNVVNQVQTGVAPPYFNNILVNTMSSAKPNSSDDGLVTQSSNLNDGKMLSSSSGDQGTRNVIPRVTVGPKLFHGNIVNLLSIGSGSSLAGLISDITQVQTGVAPFRDQWTSGSVAPECVDLIQEARLQRLPTPPISTLQNVNGHTEESSFRPPEFTDLVKEASPAISPSLPLPLPENGLLTNVPDPLNIASMLEDVDSTILDLFNFEDQNQQLGDMEDPMSISTSCPIRAEDYPSLDELLFEDEQTPSFLENEPHFENSLFGYGETSNRGGL